MNLGERIKARLDALGMSQAALARAVGVSPQAISKLVAGSGAGSAKVYLIARALETTPEYLLGEIDDAGPVPVGSPSDDQLLQIPVLDIEYGMGATYLDSVHPQVRLESFPKSFIRRYTKARGEDLFIAEGLGDSMAPTIGTSDLLLIDRTSNSLMVSDQIWAFSFGGAGMVKRLRPRPDGSVAILSDNPSVPEDRAVDDELFLIGRVVAIVRKV